MIQNVIIIMNLANSLIIVQFVTLNNLMYFKSELNRN